MSYTFTGYGHAARYVKWEDGGQDTEYWAGHYGARFSCASLQVDFEKPQVYVPAPPPVNVKPSTLQPSEQVLDIIESKKKFVDNQFPQQVSSVYAGDWTGSRINFVWKRMRDILQSYELFKDGTDANDIEQGALGNCWYGNIDNMFILLCRFLSALATLARHSYFVKNIFLTENVNDAGIYEVQIYNGGLPERIVVDEYVPCHHSNVPCFSKCKGNELWVVLLEKAYAKMHGCYSMLTGGNADCALQDLTGMLANF